jgi:ribose 5-phosphate isomerase A
MDRNEVKRLVAYAAVDELVKDGMKLGLGTGSTAIHAATRVGERLRDGTLHNILAVPTSLQTSIECEKWGVPLTTLNAWEIGGALDLTIDGADEVDPGHRCIKGGGAALLVEKVTAYASHAFAIVADAPKLVHALGPGFPVPVEVIPEARITVTRALEALGAQVTLRAAMRKAGPVITEHANVILDIHFETPPDPAKMEVAINSIPGVVENGFFTGAGALFPPFAPLVFVGRDDGTVVHA